jgi:hypothetical protein
MSRSRTWFFELAVCVKQSAGSSYIYPSNFSDTLQSKRCCDFQKNRLADASIITFSISTDPSSTFHVGNVLVTQIVGFITSAQQKWKTVVQEWLTHPDIINLELTPIANRHENEKIKTFLDESALAEAPDAADGETGTAAAAPWPAPPQLSDGRRRRLRVDLGADSAAPRVRKGGHCIQYNDYHVVQ